MATVSIAGRGPRLLFARNFLVNPRATGSAVPSSRRLIARLLAAVDWTTARIIVEYGPGTGVVTRALLDRMAPDARLIALETNVEFVAFLRDTIVDPRLEVLAASAESIGSVLAARGLSGCDAAVSSLPFSIMPPRVRLRIVAATAAVLAPGAPLVGYQYSTRWVRELRRSFAQLAIAFEPRNWPPAFVFVARGTGAGQCREGPRTWLPFVFARCSAIENSGEQGDGVASGFLALLDDVAAIAKVAAASLDDTAAAAAKASAKAAGVVIDDAAVTPRYVQGFAAERELPIVGKIALGSLRNKLLYLLPGALMLSWLAPWAITPLLMAGGAYLTVRVCSIAVESAPARSPARPPTEYTGVGWPCGGAGRCRLNRTNSRSRSGDQGAR